MNATLLDRTMKCDAAAIILWFRMESLVAKVVAAVQTRMNAEETH